MEKTLVYASFTPPQHYHFTVTIHGLQEPPTLCYVQKRPGVDKLLLELSKNYEIILFTASCKEFADPILRRLDIHDAINHRLYRDSLVKASPDPLAVHDFTISRISGRGLSEFSHIVPYYVMKRPGVDEFLAELSKDYEIVVFTEGQKQMVDLILGFLDFDFVIKKRLYRDSCTKGVKDLMKISCEKKRGDLDLKNVAIVDHDPVAWKLQPKNGVLVSRFEGDIHDRELYGLIGFFKDALEFEDVGEAISSIERFGT